MKELEVQSDLKGKPLAELRTEVELGLRVYPLPDGYCSVSRCRGAGLSGDVDYVWAACDDEWWPSFDELLEAFGDYALQPIWTTFDNCGHHPPIEAFDARYEI